MPYHRAAWHPRVHHTSWSRALSACELTKKERHTLDQCLRRIQSGVSPFHTWVRPSVKLKQRLDDCPQWWLLPDWQPWEWDTTLVNPQQREW